MNLEQLDILIRLKRGDLNPLFFSKDDLNQLITNGWIKIDNTSSDYTLTQRAEARIISILAMPSGPEIDPQVIENYCAQITYEIKEKLRKHTKEFLKNGTVRISIMAKPEVMNELVTKYAADGWEANHENGSILLKWSKIPKNIRTTRAQ